MSIEVSGVPGIFWWALAIWMLVRAVLAGFEAYLTYLKGKRQRFQNHMKGAA